jgi:hypothetical protein
MHNKFELRIDRIRLRSDGRNVPDLQDKYIARAGGGAYMAVAPTEECAIKEVLRTMRMHYHGRTHPQSHRNPVRAHPGRRQRHPSLPGHTVGSIRR